MTPETAPSRPARETGPILIAAGIVLVVALVSFARIRVPGAEPVPDELSWPEGAPVQSFRDPDLGLKVALPAAWERVFEPAEESGSDVRAVFRDPVGGATVALEAWDAASLAPFPLWLGVMAGDMTAVAAEPAVESADQAVAGGSAPAGPSQPEPNALLAGNPAWVMWRPAAGESPVVYAAFLQKGGRYLRLKLEQPAHSNSGDDFRRVLASVEWPEGAGEVAVPELPGAPAP